MFFSLLLFSPFWSPISNKPTFNDMNFFFFFFFKLINRIKRWYVLQIQKNCNDFVGNENGSISFVTGKDICIC